MSTTSAPRGTPNRGRGAITSINSPSNIPRPSDHHSEVGASSTLSASRAKQSKRDEAIRKKIESDLSKKRAPNSRLQRTRKAPPGSVLALKPSTALQIKPHTSVAEAAQLMAAKREDCVLVTDDDERIAGIFTAKDLAFRVVGAGIKARDITIAEIMTKNPLCAKTDTSATDALDLMVRKGFRHLPVMDENHDIAGILDITKCFYEAMEKLERAYSSSRKLYDALEGVQAELGSSQPQQVIQYVEAIRAKMSGPTLETVLTGLPPTTVSVRTSVKEAAQLMKENHTTAVLVQDQGSITGIFTSKDVVLRVIAAGLDPGTCSVVRVMTPHPDFAPIDMSIQAALRKMHDGHYLNLPVMSDAGEIVGMVDVLKLTYATLDQINSMQSGDSEGPAWNKFWLSLDHESESIVSGDGGSHHPHTEHSRSQLISPTQDRHFNHLDRVESVMPNESASRVGAETPDHSVAATSPAVALEDRHFNFKFKAPSGRTHRFQAVPSAGLGDFISQIVDKLGTEIEAVGGAPILADGHLSHSGFSLSYLDNEGDSVSITTKHDLLDAVTLAKTHHSDKVDLFVCHPEHSPFLSNAAPQMTPAVSTPEPVIRERKKHMSDTEQNDQEPPEHRRKRKQQQIVPSEQIIQGIPNELLLPGAIATLAVVIIGVFALGRVSSR